MVKDIMDEFSRYSQFSNLVESFDFGSPLKLGHQVRSHNRVSSISRTTENGEEYHRQIFAILAIFEFGPFESFDVGSPWKLGRQVRSHNRVSSISRNTENGEGYHRQIFAIFAIFEFGPFESFDVGSPWKLGRQVRSHNRVSSISRTTENGEGYHRQIFAIFAIFEFGPFESFDVGSPWKLGRQISFFDTDNACANCFVHNEGPGPGNQDAKQPEKRGVWVTKGPIFARVTRPLRFMGLTTGSVPGRKRNNRRRIEIHRGVDLFLNPSYSRETILHLAETVWILQFFPDTVEIYRNV
ncbi:hypothetical protein WN48_00857 [Eufriesea mexicana]|nr:hypothetical protein WN48_00857 [Eufriesea mexicana]